MDNFLGKNSTGPLAGSQEQKKKMCSWKNMSLILFASRRGDWEGWGPGYKGSSHLSTSPDLPEHAGSCWPLGLGPSPLAGKAQPLEG